MCGRSAFLKTDRKIGNMVNTITKLLTPPYTSNEVAIIQPNTEYLVPNTLYIILAKDAAAPETSMSFPNKALNANIRKLLIINSANPGM